MLLSGLYSVPVLLLSDLYSVPVLLLSGPNSVPVLLLSGLKRNFTVLLLYPVHICSIGNSCVSFSFIHIAQRDLVDR